MNVDDEPWARAAEEAQRLADALTASHAAVERARDLAPRPVLAQALGVFDLDDPWEVMRGHTLGLEFKAQAEAERGYDFDVFVVVDPAGVGNLRTLTVKLVPVP